MHHPRLPGCDAASDPFLQKVHPHLALPQQCTSMTQTVCAPRWPQVEPLYAEGDSRSYSTSEIQRITSIRLEVFMLWDRNDGNQGDRPDETCCPVGKVSVKC